MPDPLNLLVKTIVGKQAIGIVRWGFKMKPLFFMRSAFCYSEALFFLLIFFGGIMKKALSIAGSDCSGGAGIQADLKTFSSHGVYGMSVVTAVVAENTVRVIDFQDITPEMIAKQIDAVFEDIVPDAVKVGMLSCVETMDIVAEKLRKWESKNIVIDPVMYAKNGSALMSSEAMGTLKKEILPLATVLTPNIPEAEAISGIRILNQNDMMEAARIIHQMGCKAIIVKGGHCEGDAIDVVYDGCEFQQFSRARIPTKNTHGTGCTFSSAITSNIAKGLPLKEAVSLAKEYITQAIKQAISLGEGHGPVNHFYNFFPQLKEQGE